MNEEYLWQKTGEDPEIANLEKALAAFRYREDAPPALTIHAAVKPRKWRLVLAFAAPAFATVAVAAGLWMRSDEEITFIHQPPTETLQKAPEVIPPAVQPSAPTKQPVERHRPEVLLASTTVPRKARERTRTHKTGTVVLTKEERYAYQQLMLALSISSSQINIVRNTINGVEENQPATKQDNR